MKVRLSNDWFAPGAELFKKGVQEIPERLLEHLPDSAEVLEKPRKQRGAAKPAAEDEKPEGDE